MVGKIVRPVILIALVLAMVFLVPREPLREALALLGGMPWHRMVPLFALQTLVLALIAVQWTMLLGRIPSQRPVRWPGVAMTYLAGGLAEAITPSSKLGAETTRFALFRRQFGIRSIDIARAMATQALCMIAALLLVMGGSALFLLRPEAGAVVVGITMIAAFFAPFIPGKTILRVTAIAILIWVLYPLRVGLTAWALAVEITPTAILSATFGAYFAGLLPLTPGGLGTYEATMVLIFGSHGVPPGDAAAVTALARIVSYGWPLVLSTVMAGMVLMKPLREGDEDMQEKGGTFLSLVGWLERRARGNALFGTIYERLFYRRMIAIECAAAELSPGDAVIQVGSGPFPMTALALARQGYRVTAVDRDPDAIRVASSRTSGISFLNANAESLDYSGYAAVFVALHVAPRERVLKRILSTADEHTRILLRNPRGSLNGSYTRIRAENTDRSNRPTVQRLPGQKELLLLRTPGRDGEGCGICRLCDLAPRESARIARAPVHPQLAAMGFREGKECTILAIQPWGGPVICSVGGRDVALERSIAGTIDVEPRGENGAG